jgi:RNA polymerase sigma-70 factor (ECF subfamily)
MCVSERTDCTQETSEEQLALLFASGDRLALSILFERHKDALYRYAVKYLDDQTMAEDVVQEAFLRAYLNRRRYIPSKPFWRWLFAIAINLCRDEGKTRRRRRQLLAVHGPVGPTWANPSSTADRNLEKREIETAVEDAICRLPPLLREAFLLSRGQRMSTKEIAKAVGCSATSARQRVSRALRRLREDLSEYLKGQR